MKHTKTISTIALIAMFALPSVSAAASCAPTVNLSYGAKGSQVTKLQQALKDQGYFSGTLVANYGTATLAAVRAFQKANGIAQTGTVGPATRAALNAGCGSSSSSGGSAGTVPGGVPPTGKFEVTGWIPYWRTATGTADALPHLDEMTEVSPFVYTLKSDGSILDNGDISSTTWQTFIAAARAKNVRVVPTIMTSDRALIHKLLSNSKGRVALEDSIAKLVKDNGFDGIDIDFENKAAETKDYFSTFLKGLYQRMGNKFVMCDIETRIPNEDRYFGTEIPADANLYANDLVAINKYCDRVRIMAYDQQGIDLKLAAAAGTQLYAPVADPAWVTKVINYMSKDIKKSKILIGVPTYGYEYSVTTYEGGQHLYDILWTFNPGYAAPQAGVSQQSLAEKYHVTPERTPWGELAFTYVPVDDNATSTLISGAPNAALSAAAAASTYADQYHSHLTYRYVVWPDAVAIRQKADLAKSLGVRGISIFKIDGGEDPNMWAQLQGVKQ